MASILGRLLRRKTEGQKCAAQWEAMSAEAAGALAEKHYEHAIRLYDELIPHKQDSAEAFYKRANALNGLGRWESALTDYDRAITLNPGYAYAYCNRGAVLERLARWQEALASYDQAVVLEPLDVLTHYNRGSALKELERFEEALKSYDRAIALKGDYVAAYVNRGHVLHKLRRFSAAVDSYDKAIELDGTIAESFQGRGVSLVHTRRFREAVASYDRAIATRSDYFEAHSNRGSVLQELGRHEAALASFDKALELNPLFAAALQGRGFSLLRLQRFEDALSSYDRALTIEADRKYLLGMALYAQAQVCEWSGISSKLATLVANIEANIPTCVPLPLLALLDEPKLHKMAAELWAKNECPSDGSLGPISTRVPHDKIRIGYFSPDFCEHAVSLVTAEVFEMHDRARFEITAFAFGPRPNDAMRARLQRTFDRFIDVRDKSDSEIALLARELEIDIAVDLGGYTEFSRANIFAFRAAPVQVNYLGYPGTMGAEYMDYLIADRTVVPQSQRQYYTEKIVYLPDSFLPQDTTRQISAREFRREQLGLPNDVFVFCCFNNSYKITPAVFDSWMQVLSRVPNSVIWLAQNHATTASNLRREAGARGVDAGRLVFATRTDSLDEHLARLRVADLFLDTLPYNAHATAADALWAGLPMVTRCGESFAARVAASMLEAAGLPELITTTVQEFEDLAVELAGNPERLADIRARLLRNQSSAALFDMRAFTAHLEAGFVKILERCQAGLPPDHIYVDA